MSTTPSSLQDVRTVLIVDYRLFACKPYPWSALTSDGTPTTMLAVDTAPDWTPAIQRLKRRWRLIVATGVAAALIVAIASYVSGKHYSAQAILAVGKPDAVLEFDPRYHEPEADPLAPYRVNSLRAYPELARSSAFEAAVRRHLAEAAPDTEIPANLTDSVSVRAMAEGGLLEVEARASTPENAALLANGWADVLSAEAEAAFAGTGADNAASLRDQAAADLTKADESLVEFHATSELSALEVKRRELVARYASRVRAGDRLGDAADDLALLTDNGGATGRRIAAGLASVALELGVTDSFTDSSAVSVHLSDQLDGTVPSVAEIAGLATAVESSRKAALKSAGELPELIAETDADLLREQSQLDQLERRRELAEERFMTLARRADELTAVEEASRPEVRVVFRAEAPSGRDLSPLLPQLLTAFLLGLVAGALLALLLPDGDAPGTPPADS